MIRKTKSGYKVVSKKGRGLSKPNLGLREAMERLAEVEMFKRMKGKR